MRLTVESELNVNGDRAGISGTAETLPLTGKAVVNVNVRIRYGFGDVGAVVLFLLALCNYVDHDVVEYRLLIRLERYRRSYRRIGSCGIRPDGDGRHRFAGTRHRVVTALRNGYPVSRGYDVIERVFALRVRGRGVAAHVRHVYRDRRAGDGIAVLVYHLTGQYAVLRRVDVPRHIIIGFARGRGARLQYRHADVVPRVITVRAEVHHIRVRRDIDEHVIAVCVGSSDVFVIRRNKLYRSAHNGLVFAGIGIKGTDIAVQGSRFLFCNASERRRHRRKQGR